MIIVKDASQLPVNSALHVDKQYLVYMTETKLSIPPALLSPYTSGDADYLAALGASLNSYPRLCIDIEYLPNAPETIVWHYFSPTYRAGCVALMVDWIQKFRVGYTGEVGFYDALPSFGEFARHTIDGGSQAQINAAYVMDYQWAVDMAPLVAECDLLFPSYYFTDIEPGGPYERPFNERTALFSVATDTAIGVLRTLYPNKPIEAFVNRNDLDARISHLDSAGADAVNVWSLTSDPFTASEIAIINSYADLGVSQTATDFYYHMVNDWPANPDASPEPSNYLICQRSGFRVSVAEGLQKTWDGLFVRSQDFDQRHPQDFVRVRVERQSGSYSPELADVFINRLEAGSFYLEEGDALLLEDGDGLSYEAA